MAPGKIKQIPDLPNQITDAVNRNTLAVFIGAGVSRTLGCAGWDDLSECLINRCTTTKKSDGSPCLGEQDADVLRDYDNKKKITICKQILDKNGCEAEFFDEIERSLEADPDKLKSRNIYDELWGFRALFITTNMDGHFDAKFTPPKIAYQGGDFENKLDRNKLYHIHGKISDRASVVLTTPQYITRYNASKLRDFLTSIFAKYTVLFVGYGMEEFELLDFIIGKYKPDEKIELKHYILKPFKTGEEKTLRFEDYYYNPMGINVIPYHIGNGDYGKLYDVIQAWNREINQSTRYLYESFSNLEESVKDPTAERIEDALQFIQNDVPQRRHLFRLLETTANPQPWLETLYNCRYLDPDRNPRPQKVKTGYYIVPYWEVLGFLENAAAKNLKTPSGEVTNLILTILESIIYYRTETGERIENHHTNASMAKVIFSLPLDKITSAHYAFIKTALNTSWETIHIATAIEEVALPRFIAQKEREHILKLIDIIFEYHKVDGLALEEYTSRIEPYWINEILKGRTKEIADICGHEAAEVALEKIRQITTQDNNQFNHVWIPAIEEEGFHDRFDVQIIEFIRTLFENSDVELLKGTIEGLIHEEHPIFNRIAIHTINYHYDTLKEIFWSLDYNPLIKYQLDHEVSELLKAHCVSFLKEEITRIMGWICENDPVVDNIDPAHRGLHTACQRKWWLSALAATGDPEVLAEYARCDIICPMEVHALEDGPATISFIGDLSPIEKEDLLKMPTSKIVEYLRSYREEPGFNGFSSRGLACVFGDCVAAAPDKFFNILEERPELPSIYQSTLLGGLAGAVKGGFAQDWGLILDYILYLIEPENFRERRDGDAAYDLEPEAVLAISDLITESVRHAEYRSRPELRSKTERVLTILADRTDLQVRDASDYAMLQVVTPQSAIFCAMISYSMGIAPIIERESGYRWVGSIRDQFVRRLSRPSERSLEFSVVLGRSLPQLCYLDEDWVTENLDNIFPRNDEDHWRLAFSGYIRYTQPSRKCYRLLKVHGDYSKSLEVFDGDHEVRKLLIASICRGYLNAEEELDEPGSLLSELIERGDLKQISTMIWAIWYFNRHDLLNAEMKGKVKALWGRLIDRYAAGEVDRDKQKILAGLFDWISVFDEIDDEMYEWLKISAAYVRNGVGGLHFFDYLLERVEVVPEKVAELILVHANAGGHFPYKIKQLQQIVDSLYRSGQKERANRICNSYLAADHDYLREIYSWNN